MMMGTWREHHDWEYRFWHSGNLPPLQNQELYDRASEISPNAPEQFQSDVARYEILYLYGGVWVDADFVCQRPIDDLMKPPIWAGQVAQVLNNAIIGAEPEHPLMFDLIAKLPANASRHPQGAGNTVKSGPQFFTPIARRHGITEYPARYFYPFTWEQLDRDDEDFPDAYAVHRWGNARRKSGLAWK